MGITSNQMVKKSAAVKFSFVIVNVVLTKIYLIEIATE